MLIGGVIYSSIMGMKLFQTASAKLGENDQARITIAKLVYEIRSSKDLDVGSGTLTTFTQAADGSAQSGSSLRIYPSTNISVFVRYFYDTNTSTLRRTEDGSSYTTVAQNVTNQTIFTAQDYSGVTLSNRINNRVIAIVLQLLPTKDGNATNAIDYYALRSKVTRRSLQ